MSRVAVALGQALDRRVELGQRGLVHRDVSLDNVWVMLGAGQRPTTSISTM